LPSQADTYADRYLQQTGARAVLFAGNGQARYPFKPENTYFLFGTDFKKGNITYDGIYYSNVLLNVDGYLDQLYAKSDTSSHPVLMVYDKVSSFTANGHKFLHAEDLLPDGSQVTGYVEILMQADSCILLRKTRMIHCETTEGRYVTHYFEPETAYYLMHGRILDKVKGKAVFTKAFPSKKKALNATWQQFSHLKKTNAGEVYLKMLQTAIEK